MKPTNWINLKSSQPPQGELVATKIDDASGPRNEQPLRLRGRMWYVHDDSMYVYYVPTHWHPIDRTGDAI